MKNIAVLIALVLAGCGGGGSGPTPVPTATLTASAKLDGTTDLTWSSSNATSCALSGSSATTLATSGSTNVAAPITSQQSYTLTCIGAGGSGTAKANATPPNSYSTICTPTTIATTAFWIGDFAVHNDEEGNVPGITPQCQSGSVTTDGTIDVITKWDYDTSSGIKAAPGYQYGATEPVAGFGQSTASGYPVLVSNISSTFSFAYTETLTGVSAGSAYDLLFDFYFSDNTNLVDETLEMGIDPLCVNSCYGTPVDTVTIDGVTYNVISNPSSLHTFSSHPGLAFNCTASCGALTASGTINVKHFIDYAVAHGYLANTDYFGNVAIQNEVFAGAATSELTTKVTN